MSAVKSAVVLASDEWRDLERDHAERADELTAAHRARAARGQKHPVEDFLFTYYPAKPSVLRRWHPGAHTLLRDAAERQGWRWYRAGDIVGSATMDHVTFAAERETLIDSVRSILTATAGRAPAFGCFGLHEWAMLYRSEAPRHDVPLRLGARGTNDVVESHELRCTHIDAFRFFTPDSVPRNRTLLLRENQVADEQPGCLHAGMDLYRYAIKLGPLVPGGLLLDCFAFAREIRAVDMRASPYDLTNWGYEPIAVESAEGKAEYVRRQRGFAERAGMLRARLLAAVDA